MKELILSNRPMNPAVLDAELRAALGADYLGMSTRPGEIILFLEDSASAEIVQAAQAIVLAHDANVLSEEQQAELLRQEALANARNTYVEGVDLNAFAASAQDVQSLASLVAWLELEIRDLRGL